MDFLSQLESYRCLQNVRTDKLLRKHCTFFFSFSLSFLYIFQISLNFFFILLLNTTVCDLPWRSFAGFQLIFYVRLGFEKKALFLLFFSFFEIKLVECCTCNKQGPFPNTCVVRYKKNTTEAASKHGTMPFLSRRPLQHLCIVIIIVMSVQFILFLFLCSNKQPNPSVGVSCSADST